MENFPVLNLKSLKDQVYDYLREQMFRGIIRPGSVINMDLTAKQLGISKTPLRDALIRLEMEGFVSILPRRAVVVNVLNYEDIQELYQIIGALESSALLSALSKMKPEDIKKMEKLNTGMKYALENDDFDSYYEKNLQFHNIYLDLCGNDRLIKTVFTMKKRLYDFPRQKEYVKEWEESSILEHAELIRLIAEEKAVEASHFIRAVHWSYEVQEKFVKKYYPADYGSETVKEEHFNETSRVLS